MNARTVLMILFVACSRALVAAAADERPINFQRDVRPILSANCFLCHGPDPEHREADLRLDDEASAKDYAIEPGKPDESEVITRITSDDPDERMPPADSGKTLSAEEIAVIRRWIEQGAPYDAHWAFVAPERPPVPAAGSSAWVRNPIDAFVLDRLNSEGLAPAEEADPVTLARRLSLDLVGLPPSPEEVDRFVADRSASAYEQQVARLLASPHYGERWGRLWLDAARYADSNGYEKDLPRQVWFYRDWVVDALNRDMPYDEFIVDQVAGDLLPNPTQDDLVATGFLRNSMINEEGGVDPEQFRMEAMYDRMDAIGKAVLGLTVQCGQCHSHKYDPLTQEEYYRMFAFLNNCHEANIAVYTRDEQQQHKTLLHKIHAVETRLQRNTPDWPTRMAAWEAEARKAVLDWEVLEPVDLPYEGQKFRVLDDQSILSEGYAPKNSTSEFGVRTTTQEITGFRLELLTHPQLPRGGPGRSVRGTGAVTQFDVFVAPADAPGKREKVKLVAATADVNPPEAPQPDYLREKDAANDHRVTGPIGFAIDDDNKTAWAIDVGAERTNQPRKAVFVPEKPIGFPQGTVITFRINMSHGGWNSDDNHNCLLGRFRFSLTTASDPVADPLPAPVREILAIAPEDRTPDQTAAVFSFWRTTVPEWEKANERIEHLWQQHPQGTTQLVLQERAEPRVTSLLERGDFLKPVHPVEPGVPAFLHPLVTEGPPTRIDFARWLVDERSPTTARAIVNRIWQAYFGIGLVETSEDLGSQGTPPSHPELLDWLAVEFMEHGWSQKHLHRLIVSSSTYRQSSTVTPDLVARDPYNRLLARGPRFRVDAEVVRDVSLAASGLLNPTIGGPSVCPPAPEFLFQPPASYGPKTWNVATGEDRYRRGLYTFRFRSVPYPMLETFDAPIGNVSCVRRSRSNTPLQALTSLNEPLFVECAQALAAKVLAEGGASDESRITLAMRRCVARVPTDEEINVLQTVLDRQRQRIADGELKPSEIVGEAAEDASDTSLDELAAWTIVARVVLNLDETITKE